MISNLFHEFYFPQEVLLFFLRGTILLQKKKRNKIDEFYYILAITLGSEKYSTNVLFSSLQSFVLKQEPYRTLLMFRINVKNRLTLTFHVSQPLQTCQKVDREGSPKARGTLREWRRVQALRSWSTRALKSARFKIFMIINLTS